MAEGALISLSFGVASALRNVRLVDQGHHVKAEPTALERDRQRHREFRDSRDRRQRYETVAMSPRQRAEKLWTHGGAE